MSTVHFSKSLTYRWVELLEERPQSGSGRRVQSIWGKGGQHDSASAAGAMGMGVGPQGLSACTNETNDQCGVVGGGARSWGGAYPARRRNSRTNCRRRSESSSLPISMASSPVIRRCWMISIWGWGAEQTLTLSRKVRGEDDLNQMCCEGQAQQMEVIESGRRDPCESVGGILLRVESWEREAEGNQKMEQIYTQHTPFWSARQAVIRSVAHQRCRKNIQSPALQFKLSFHHLITW